MKTDPIGTRKITYRMVETQSFVEEAGVVTTYGICCEESTGQDGEPVVSRTVPAISTKPGFVEDLVDKLIACGASPVHLMDIIADHLV